MEQCLSVDLKIAIVGLGSMGRRRVRNLRHLGVREIIGVEPREDRRREVAQSHGITAVASLDAALALRPDAVIVSTPPAQHLEFALTAARNGLHVFTEADTSDEGVDEVLAAAARHKIVAAPSCTMRFHPAVKLIRELAEAGRVGRLLTFTHHAGQYLPDWHPWEDYRQFYVSKRETGACREIVPFELCWITGIVGRVERISGLRAKLSDLETDIDDVYHLLVRTAGNIAGQILVDVLARPAVRSFRLLGSEGTIEWVAATKCVRLYDAKTATWREFKEPEARVEAGYTEMSVESMYIDEMAAFIGAIRGESPYPYSFEEDRDNLRALYAAEQSSDESRFIDLAR
jgi:predicted dehydrogenase